MHVIAQISWFQAFTPKYNAIKALNKILLSYVWGAKTGKYNAGTALIAIKSSMRHGMIQEVKISLS